MLFDVIRSMTTHIDLACIPIGGYSPRILRSGRNCSPTDAVMMFEDLKAEFGLAIGWGTWGTTNEETEAIRNEFIEAMIARGMPPLKFNVTNIGQSIGYHGPDVDVKPRCRNRSEWVKMKRAEKKKHGI